MKGASSLHGRVYSPLERTESDIDISKARDATVGDTLLLGFLGEKIPDQKSVGVHHTLISAREFLKLSAFPFSKGHWSAMVYPLSHQSIQGQEPVRTLRLLLLGLDLGPCGQGLLHARADWAGHFQVTSSIPFVPGL